MYSRRIPLAPLLAFAATSLIVTTGCNRDPNVRKQKYLESGKRYEKEGKDREATIQFANALKVDRNFANAHYELGNTYIHMGSMAAGYAELMHAVELDPKNIQARLDLGNLQLAGGLPEKAFEQANAVLAMAPGNAQAYALLANYWGRKGDRDQALQSIQKALAIDPSQSNFHVILAMLQAPTSPGAAAAAPAGSNADSIQELQKAISLEKSNVSARMMLASILERQNDTPGAIAQVKDAIAVAPTQLQPRQFLTSLYLHAGDKASAEQTLRQAADDLPDDPTAASLLSSFYMSQGQIGQADSAYADLSAKHPKSIELKLSYARILVLERQTDKAQKLATELTKSAPNNPQVAILNSSLLLGAGKIKEASDTLQKSLGNTPDSLDLKIALGKVSVLLRDYPTATKVFTDALHSSPKNLDAATGLAEVADHNRDANQLIQLADKALAFAPDFASAYVWRGTGEGLLGKLDKAQQDFTTALQKDPKNFGAEVALGDIKLVQKKNPEANALFEKALEINPESAVALNELVRSEYAEGHPDKALASVKNAIARAPNAEPLYNVLAGLQLSTKDFAGARDTAAKAVSLKPSDEEAVQFQAQAEIALGHTDAALALWQAWIQAHPNDAAAQTMAGLLEERVGNPAKAAGFYKKAIELQPGVPTAAASNNLAYLMVEQNQDLDQALQYAQQARQALPDNPGTADTLAWVYYHRGRYATAKDLLEGAIRQNPDDAAMQLHLGLTYDKLNDKANAILHLKKAATLAPAGTPTAQQASQALARLS